MLRKKEKDVFILKDQLRVLSEQYQKLNLENQKMIKKGDVDIEPSK